MSGLQAFGDILTPAEAQEPILARPVRNALMEWLQEIWSERDLKEVGLAARKRAMFSGVPGTGKTTLAHHIAARLGLPMLVVRSEKLQSSFVSGSAQAVGRLFDTVRAQPKPVFLFFDEFDSMAAKRMDSGHNQVGEQDHNLTVNVMLSHFDRHDGFIVAATNYAARVDEALWRRFEIQIDIETPGDMERRHIIARYLAPFVLPDAALVALSEALETATPALIRQFCEHIKRQIVVGPKAGWDMDRAAVISRLIASVQPHPDAGKPRIWSHGAADKAVARMPWPLARRLEDYPPAAAPSRVEGVVDLAARRAAEKPGGRGMNGVTEFLGGRVRLFAGDCIEQLNRMEPDSVDCVVTSPPYWGLRDYGVEGQIGLEPTLAEHLEVMVAVFEAMRRVLKPTGTLWLNYGDCYATAPNGRSAADTKLAASDDRTFRDKPFSTVGPIFRAEYEKTDRTGQGGNKGNLAGSHGGRVIAGGYLKPKDLCMIPNRLAIALQDAGWWVRSEIIWGKSNPMPDSSGAYRPATAHEKIFMLTKTGDGDVWRARDTGEISFFPDLSEVCALVTDADRFGPRWSRIGAYYDAGAVRMEPQPSSVQRWSQDIESQVGSTRVNGGRKTNGAMKAVGGARHRRGREQGKVLEVTPRHQNHINHTGLDELGRGQGRYLRNYEPAQLTVWHMATQAFKEAHFATFPPELAERCILAGCPKGGLVLDPFGGAGTTALVALRHGRRADLIELNPEYAAIARRRIEADWRVVQKLPEKPDLEPLALFGGIS